MKANTKKQREAWLVRAVNIFRREWAKLDVAIPADVQVTCGFPGGGSPNKRIGECWPRARSRSGVNEMMINPVLQDTLTVLDVLGHECLHAVDDCASKHGRVFTKNSAKVGYSGGKHSAAVSVPAKALLAKIAKQLKPYPHGAVILVRKENKSNSGLHKFACCTDVLYSTAKMVEQHGCPTCRECGEEMQLFDRTKKPVIETI